MIENLIKPLLVAVASVSLLTGCFVQTDPRPRTKVIEYDEEVKLHDGSMIWVHIKRHYVLAGGGALGDPGAFKAGYVPKEVEISWDTGFPNVGRKSVFFDDQVALINKYNDIWYIAGARNSSNFPEKINDSINCNNVGSFTGSLGCVVSVTKDGNFRKPNPDDLYKFNQMNILYPLVPIDKLNNMNLSWATKLNIEKDSSTYQKTIGQSYRKGATK